MEIIGLQDAIKARKEKNTYSIFEITTTPGLAERIDYLLLDDQVIRRLVYDKSIGMWKAHYDVFPITLTDSAIVRVQWKSVVRPNDGLADLKYTLGA